MLGRWPLRHDEPTDNDDFTEIPEMFLGNAMKLLNWLLAKLEDPKVRDIDKTRFAATAKDLAIRGFTASLNDALDLLDLERNRQPASRAGG